MLWVGAVQTFLFALTPLPVSAAAPPQAAVPAGLSFAEIKITGDEFLVLQNNSGTDLADLSSYWLEDFNNVSPLAAGVNNSAQQLPQVRLLAGQTLLLSSTAMPTCGAAVAGRLSISLTDSGGFLELVQLGQDAGGAVTQTPGDVVNWSNDTAGDISNVLPGSKDPRAAWYRYQNAADYAWQPADLDAGNACQLNVAAAGTAGVQPVQPRLGQTAVSPPATIVALAAASTGSAATHTMPVADLGLLAPQISELVPNPAGTGTDKTDEFVELYNPNSKAFDLNGFTLRVGITTTHDYVFPAGTSLKPKSFKAFYAAVTGLAMSNTGGQAVLLDPLGTAIGQSGVYSSAKDGQAWALANGQWYWTTDATPGGANVVNQATGSKTAGKAGSTAKSDVKGAATSLASSPTAAADALQPTPVHPWTLALVALLALLYGAYEYRVDLANYLHQFRKHRAARRVAGQ